MLAYLLADHKGGKCGSADALGANEPREKKIF